MRLGAQDPVLDRGQEAVGDELVERHPAPERRTGLGEARAEDQVGTALDDRRDHPRDDFGLVLAVGVEHDHDVSPALERLQITGLLVPAVADVVRVPDEVERQRPGHVDRLVGRLVVNEDDLVDPLGRDPVHRRDQCPGRVSRRHDHEDPRLRAGRFRIAISRGRGRSVGHCGAGW